MSGCSGRASAPARAVNSGRPCSRSRSSAIRSTSLRHCERSEAIQEPRHSALDCFVAIAGAACVHLAATLLAMTQISHARHHDVLDLDVLFHAVMRAFAAEAGFLDAAERR